MKKIIFIFMSVVSFNAMASELKNNDAKALAEQLNHYIDSTLAKIIELEGGSDDSLVAFSLQNDSDQLRELGLVLTSNGRIVAVTPNSFAEDLGFKSGDRLRKVTSDDLELNTTKPIQLKVGSQFVASVDRAGEILEFEGIVKAKRYGWQLNVNTAESQANSQIVDDSACGRISVFASPPETKGYYPVLFNQLNGNNVSQSRNVLRLAPGIHKIKLNELINARGLRIRRPLMVKGKILEINVKPNKTYYLAAEFDSNKRLKSKGEEYWKPIVWKVADKECEL